MEQPELFVFAGPNGAGKSTLSALMVPPGTPIFDGDKEFILLKKQFQGLDSGDLYDAVNGHIFSDWKDDMQRSRRTCAFETNFNNTDVMKSVDGFKQKDFATRLIFFGLDDLALSVERVKLRVLKGGHDVSFDNIKANFEQGLSNLQKYYSAFDQVILLKSASEEAGQKISVYLKLENGKIKEQGQHLPNWVDGIVHDISHRLAKEKDLNQSRQRSRSEGFKRDDDPGLSIGSSGIKR